MASLLTTTDLDGLGADAVRARDPRPYADELVSAVDEGRLADPEDAGYALSMAAEAREQAGDHDRAVELSARSVAAGAETLDAYWIRGGHAERLLRLGREDEGMAELATLRPLLLREPRAVRPISDALTENGRGEIAEQWLSAAMITMIEREERLTEGSEEQLDAADLVDELLGHRRTVRADLGLPPDEYDALVDEMDAAPDLVFLPEAEHTRLLAAQPDLADEFGRDWDAHRALVESELQAADAEGDALVVEVATPAMVAAMLDDTSDADPVGTALAWPPGRNDPCWCGSRTKYKKCCLPRGRVPRESAAPEPAPEPTPTPAPAPAASTSERVIRRGTGSRPRAR
ncbi:SEC-C domain-containing protein [Actinomycetospora flava]|uniref:SEC-C domain-containing protein n=1 Tax=Actinomycetospora flava TaxID=3129232 RepID=A0ABU8M621_9PSEU